MRLGAAGPGRWRLAAACLLLTGACVSDPPPLGSDLAARDEVHAVPAEHATIQEAVDAAEPGDLVLVAAGVYREAIDVTTDDLVIRGEDRNDVILDGGATLENGVQVLEADGVAVENLTVRDYSVSGVSWVRATGYRGAYLTAHDNGEHGVLVSESTVGTLTRSYASGNRVAGFAISQCHPCDVLVRDVVAERNGAGYAGIDAGGDLLVVASRFRHNRAGIVPAGAGAMSAGAERDTVVVGNLVEANNAVVDADNPSLFAGGVGILVAGGSDHLIERNLVRDHDKTGIATVVRRGAGRRRWPTGNVVRGNHVERSGVADLAALTRPGAGNCFAGNTHRSSAPARIEQVLPCAGVARGDLRTGALDPAVTAAIGEPGGAAGEPGGAGAGRVAAPAPQDTMPAAASEPWEPAGAPPDVDVTTIALPSRP